MKRLRTRRCSTGSAALAAVIAVPSLVAAQDLEPRAFSPAPVGTNFAGLLYLHSTGGAAVDPDLPVKNIEIEVEAPALYYVRTFDFLGRGASAGLVLPYAWLGGSADVGTQQRAAQRSGPADPRFRLATNLIGGPAMDRAEFAARMPETTLGASLSIVAPFGQYDSERLLNPGSNRWALKPELGLSHPMGKWLGELSAGTWLFTENPRFFGNVRREQEPIATIQAHGGYTFTPRLWLMADATYYTGGRTKLNDLANDDRQEATRIGLTMSLPLVDGLSLKLAWAETIETRLKGSGFTTYLAALQFTWFDR